MIPLPFAEHRHLLEAYLGPLRGRVAALAALLLWGIALQLAVPQVIRFFIDTAQAGGPMRSLLLAAVIFLAVGLLGRAVSLATTYAGMSVGWSATDALRRDLAAHLLRLDMPFHKSRTPGELIERADGDVTALAEFFSATVVKMAGNSLLVAGIVILLLRESASAGAALAAYTGVTIAALVLVQRLGVRAWIGAREAWAGQTGFLEERIAATEDIRGVGAEGHTLDRMGVLAGKLVVAARAGWMANALGFAITNFLYVAGYGLGLALGAWLYLRGQVTIGTAFIIVYYIGMLAAPLEAIRLEAENLQQATAGVHRIGELMRLSPQVEEHAVARLPAGSLSVSFERVSFAYDDPPPGDSGLSAGGGEAAGRAGEPPGPVLDSVTFAVAPGRVLGVLGRTGSGKTTLTRLLFRLYDPAAGSIRLGGSDLRDLSFDDLRGRVGMVTQDVQLFHASVRDNIALFDPGENDAAIERSLSELGLLRWIAAMPQGLDTVLAPGGGMSAGEAQLLAFTRILLRDPGVVILDEAASRLDPITEQRLERAVDRLLQRRTAIVIAHRLHTVQRADDILILESGRVAELGQRAVLAADPASRFAALLSTGLEEMLA